MIEWFARNSVAANLLMISIMVGGLLAIKTEVVLEAFPTSEPDTISISVSLRGATPEDVELGVATRVEEAIQDLEGIDEITSVSSEGSTRISVEVNSDYNPRDVLDEVKSRVDAINTFPQEAERPNVSLSNNIRSVIDVVVAGNYSEMEIMQFAEQVREDLLNLGGITQAELSSVREYEISVELSQDRLREWGLTINDISRAISNSSLDASAGNLRSAGGDILIRSKGQAYNLTDFENIVVKTNVDGSIVKMGDVAKVSDGFEEELLSSVFNGKYAAFVQVSRVGDQSVLEIAQKVKDYIEDKQATLPEGVSLSYWDDDSESLRSRLGTLQTNAIQGGILVILLLTLFLRPSIAFWVFMGIPVSFLGAFIIMGSMGTTLNIMSAFGFIVVLGIVVDDAIVTGENVYRHLRTSESGIDAAINGTKEVAIPVTFGVLTTMVAFAPIAYIEGRMGTFFGNIPKVVIPVLLFSLIESKLVLPAHLKHIRLRQNGSGNWFTRWQKGFADSFERGIIRYFRPMAAFTAEHRYATLAAFIGTLALIIAMLMSGWARWVFFERVEADSVNGSITMPLGTPFEVTQRHVTRITDAVFEMQEKYRDPETGESPIIDVLSMTGSTGGRGANSNTGRIEFSLTPPENRVGGIRASALLEEWRQKVGNVPGAETVSFSSTLFSTGSPIDIQFTSSSMDTLSEVGQKVKDRLATYPTVYEIMDSLSDGKEELQVDLTEQGYVLGLTRSEIIDQIGQAFKGVQVQRIQRGRDDVSVVVRFSQQERASIDTLNQMLITTANGVVPLSDVARLTYGKGPSEITRINGYRVMNVTAEVGDDTNLTTLQADLLGYVDDLLLQYPGVRYTLEGQAREQARSFSSLQSGLVMVCLAIYVLLALPLRSYIQPIIVMSVIPFGLIGAVLGHWILGYALQIGSLMGMLALLGVMINDSLVLVNYINQQLRAGVDIRTAVVESGVSRFRPVLLTSLTTFFGLFPLMMEKSIQASFLVPMALSLGFGILFATLVTLILVPANVLIVNDIKQLIYRYFGREMKPHNAQH